MLTGRPFPYYSIISECTRFSLHCHMESEETAPAVEFPFPFQPYGIQKEFMKQLYVALERGAVGIFESPTGTVNENINFVMKMLWVLK